MVFKKKKNKEGKKKQDKKHKLSKKKKKKSDKKSLLKKYLKLAGKNVEESEIIKRRIRNFSISISALLSIVTFFIGVADHDYIWIIKAIIFIWTIGFFLLDLVAWGFLFLWLDIRIFKRKSEVEDVFPDFLMLVASNINAGMTIDRAIILASRSRFGALAEDIDEIARKLLAGRDIETCLREFGEKYNSPIIRRSIALIIKGIESGGRVADLLNRVAVDIQENRILRKEMAANVTTYVIFISAAALLAAPLLFALTTQLIIVIQKLMANINVSEMPSTGALTINFSKDAINITYFKIYAYSLLAFMSIISGALVSIIKDGSVKKGIKKLPIFLIVAIFIYVISSAIIGKVLSGFIG